MSCIDKHMTESLKDHELTMIAELPIEYRDMPPIKAFYMKKPGTRIYSVLLVFTPEGIGLTGDVMFGNNVGLWSARGGYGLGWFSSDLSEDYLCEKFLKSDHWDADRAANEGVFEVDPDDDAALAVEKKDIRMRLKDRDIDSPNYLAMEMEAQGFGASCEIPGYGYDSAAAGWLCAVQQRFRELYAKQEGSEHGQKG